MNDVVVKQQVLTIYSPTVVTKALHENKADPEYRSAFDKECWGIVVWMVLKQDMGETLGFFDGRTSVGRCGCVARNEAHYTAPGHDGRYNEYRTGTMPREVWRARGSKSWMQRGTRIQRRTRPFLKE